MARILLEVAGLCKSFGALKATNDLSFTVTRNHIHALIGPNGAGKTTLVNQLSGDLLPDSGDILFNGVNVTGQKAYQRGPAGYREIISNHPYLREPDSS